MEFRAIYEKRFHGPLAYIFIKNTPFEHTQQVTEWLQRQRIHRNFKHENYTLLRVMKNRKGMFVEKDVPTIEIDYEGTTGKKKREMIQKYKEGGLYENTNG